MYSNPHRHVFTPIGLNIYSTLFHFDLTLLFINFASTNLPPLLCLCVYRPTPTMLESGMGSEVCVSVVPEVCVPEWSVCEWLQSAGFERYTDTLAAAGYTSIDSLLALTHQ